MPLLRLLRCAREYGRAAMPPNLVTDSGEIAQSDRGIDGGPGNAAAATEHDHSEAQSAPIDSADESVDRRLNLANARGGSEMRVRAI
jgi:hypothetical protein